MIANVSVEINLDEAILDFARIRELARSKDAAALADIEAIATAALDKVQTHVDTRGEAQAQDPDRAVGADCQRLQRAG